jgi:polyisoprenyl-phosphate glycosyltransferase
MTTVSVVVPVYSGEAYLADLVKHVDELRERWRTGFEDLELLEMIFVDDASIDGSAAALDALSSQHGWIQVLTLSRNFGQHPATIGGILHTQGDWVATLDEDLQHRPEFIEELLLRAVSEEVDVVYARPTDAVHGSWRRDTTSRLTKRILARVAGNEFIPAFNSFRLCRGVVARAASSVCGHETYFDIALTWFTDRIATQPVEMVDLRYQASARSGYSFRKLVSHARRLLISSYPKALRLTALLGTIAVAIAVFFGGRAMIQRLTGSLVTDVPGWASLFVGIMTLGGLTILMLVVALEYLASMALHTQGKPVFFVVDRSADAGLLDRLQAGRASASDR